MICISICKDCKMSNSIAASDLGDRHEQTHSSARRSLFNTIFFSLIFTEDVEAHDVVIEGIVTEDEDIDETLSFPGMGDAIVGPMVSHGTVKSSPFSCAINTKSHLGQQPSCSRARGTSDAPNPVHCTLYHTLRRYHDDGSSPVDSSSAYGLSK